MSTPNSTPLRRAQLTLGLRGPWPFVPFPQAVDVPEPPAAAESGPTADGDMRQLAAEQLPLELP